MDNSLDVYHGDWAAKRQDGEREVNRMAVLLDQVRGDGALVRVVVCEMKHKRKVDSRKGPHGIQRHIKCYRKQLYHTD